MRKRKTMFNLLTSRYYYCFKMNIKTKKNLQSLNLSSLLLLFNINMITKNNVQSFNISSLLLFFKMNIKTKKRWIFEHLVIMVEFQIEYEYFKLSLSNIWKPIGKFGTLTLDLYNHFQPIFIQHSDFVASLHRKV